MKVPNTCYLQDIHFLLAFNIDFIGEVYLQMLKVQNKK